jgi:hypothetical protein
MKKVTNLVAAAFVAAAIFLGTSAKAQMVPVNDLRFGIGVEGGIATGSAHDYSNLELGGTARLQYGVSQNVAITLTSGYYNFFGKEVSGYPGVKYSSLGMVPVKAGVKWFVNNGFYLSGEAGAGIETKTFAAAGANVPEAPKETKLILSPGLGWASKSWDVGLRYENYSGDGNNFGLVALRLAYGFGL